MANPVIGGYIKAEEDECGMDEAKADIKAEHNEALTGAYEGLGIKRINEKTLVGAIKTTHDEMTIASIALAEVTKRCKAEMDAAQARFRTALAAHLQAITGEQVAP